jgi:hypothetical protein
MATSMTSEAVSTAKIQGQAEGAVAAGEHEDAQDVGLVSERVTRASHRRAVGMIAIW